MAKGKSADVTGDQIELLTDEVRQLREEVRVLRDVLSEIQEEVQWGIRNGVLPSAVPPNRFRLTSMPLDAAADDFHERVNTVTPDDLAQGTASQADDRNRPSRQQSLWAADS